mgnify:CR=1 FL=1
MNHDNHENYLSASSKIDTLLERYYLNFVYGSYNKKRIIFNDYIGEGDGNILLFGDSHLITFEHIFLNSKKFFSNLYSRRFHGLTLYAANPDKYPSRYSILADSLSKINVQSIIISLGEVDCRNAIGIICKKNKITLKEYLLIAESNLISSIDFFQKLFKCNIYISTIPLPVYTDKSLWTKKSHNVELIKKCIIEINLKIDKITTSKDGVNLLALNKYANSSDYVLLGDHHIAERPVKLALNDWKLI